MAEGECTLSVQLFVELKEKFPQVSELQLKNMIKQFSNNRDKCLEALNKEYSSLSSPSHPASNLHQANNSWMNYNIDSSTSYSTSASNPWSPSNNGNISEMKPNSNLDFGPFMKATDSSSIPNIKCQSSPPLMQIAVHHITTSKPESPNPHGFCKSPSNCNSSSSPNTGNQWNWPKSQQKSHEVLITPTSSSTMQHFAKANLYIDTPNRNVTSHQTVITPNSARSTCVISPNSRLQSSMARSPLITFHSSQPGSQSGCLYSSQPSYGGHGASDSFTHLSNSPNPISWMSDINPVFSAPQFCIPVQVQPTTCSPSTLHHVSSTTYQTVPMTQQNLPSNTTSAIIHYPAIHMNNSSGHLEASESMKNPTSNHMPILQHVPNAGDNIQISRSRNGSLQEDSDYTHALLTHQHLRFDKLNEDYKLLLSQCKEREEEIVNLDREKKKSYSKGSFPTEVDVLKLRNSIVTLRMEIDSMAGELDAHNNGLTPIGVFDPIEQQHFYKNMNTGQSGSIFATPKSPQFWNNPPPRPPRYKPDMHPVPPPLPVNEPSEDTWNCSKCTYMNHQAMDKCEMCEFPRKHKAN